MKVMIVDDHPHARKAVRNLLALEPRFHVVKEVHSGEDAVREMKNGCDAALILMDIQLPGIDGLQTTRLLKNDFPHLKLIIISVSDEPADLYAALQAGAQGYLIKNVQPSGWIQYLRSIAFDGEQPPEDLSRQMVNQFQRGTGPDTGQDIKSSLAGYGFTPRELEMIEAVSRGMSNKEIAAHFHLSEHTVKNHLKHIMQKANVDNRVKLAALGMRK